MMILAQAIQPTGAEWLIITAVTTALTSVVTAWGLDLRKQRDGAVTELKLSTVTVGKLAEAVTDQTKAVQGMVLDVKEAKVAATTAASQISDLRNEVRDLADAADNRSAPPVRRRNANTGQ